RKYVGICIDFVQMSAQLCTHPVGESNSRLANECTKCTHFRRGLTMRGKWQVILDSFSVGGLHDGLEPVGTDVQRGISRRLPTNVLPAGIWRGGGAAGEPEQSCGKESRILGPQRLSGVEDTSMSDEPHTPSTGSKAGDDEERQKTDEERMMEEIAEQKDLIDTLTGDTCEEIAHRAPHEKRLGQLEFKYQLLVEKKRQARVLLKFQELYGDIFSEPCLICLNDIHVNASEKLTETFICCTDWTGVGQQGSGSKLPICPAFTLILYSGGIVSELEKSQEKAKELLLKAANLGFISANSSLAGYYFCGANGSEKNVEEAYFRASVTFALDNTDKNAAKVLGSFHFEKHQILAEPSSYLACYYTNIWTKDDRDGMASFFYSNSLLRLAEHLHGDNSIDGSYALPAAISWLRKSRGMGFEKAREQLKQWEIHTQNSCGNCGKEAQGGEKFKQCSKCKAQWYCSKECQVEAWRDGHKKDCKRASILKFEDYINAE
ncbi:hypothetical protein THAOC_17317, partial [Thalassiosira oceanica]